MSVTFTPQMIHALQIVVPFLLLYALLWLTRKQVGASQRRVWRRIEELESEDKRLRNEIMVLRATKAWEARR